MSGLVVYAVVHRACGHVAAVGQRRLNGEILLRSLHLKGNYGWHLQRFADDEATRAIERFASDAKCPACEVKAS